MKILITLGCSVVLLCGSIAGNGSYAASREAAQYPNRPIRVIVTGPAGGPTDVVARAVGESLSETLGQLVIDNRAGAAGMIGAEIVARATPDGYTLVLNFSGPLGLAPLLAASPPYDPLKDFTHLSLVASMPILLLVNPNVPAKSVPELVALAKSRPGKLNYASGGAGTLVHMAGELFKMVANVNIVHVPYKGVSPGMAALMGGEVDMMFNGLASSLPFLKPGRARALAVAGPKRTALLPDLPTFAESGLPFELFSGYGLSGPPGMPKSIVEKINGALKQALDSAAMKERAKSLGIEVIGSTPEQFITHLRDENAKMAKVIAATGMKGE